MKCYVCAQRGNETAAVGFCGYCHIALCVAHLDEVRTHTQGGMHYGCNHVLAPPASQGQGRG